MGRRWLAGSCHEHELIKLVGLGEVLDNVEVQAAGSRVPRHGQDPRAPARAGRGPPHHRPPQPKQRADNRLQAGLRALVEQSIAHLANAWALRRRCGLLYRVRDVFRVAGVLICLCRWLHPVPT